MFHLHLSLALGDLPKAMVSVGNGHFVAERVLSCTLDKDLRITGLSWKGLYSSPNFNPLPWAGALSTRTGLLRPPPGLC